jgi:acyl-CoA dehydrogenase
MAFPGYQLADELRSAQETVRTIMRDDVVPLERDMDPEATDLDPAAWEPLAAKAKESGVWALWAPSELGGSGWGAFGHAVLTEEMAQHRNGLYNPGYGIFGRTPPSVVFACSPEQAERFVKPAIRDARKTFFAMSEPTPAEPRGGTDPAAGIETRAVRDGDSWVINGRKTWISNGDDADWGVVFARTEAADGTDGVSCFFVERGQFRASPIPVIRPDYPSDLVFEDCVVPHSNLLGEEGHALAAARQMLVRNRIAFSAAHTGVAVAALRLAAEQARGRESPLLGTLGESEVDIRAARWLNWEAAWKCDREEDFRHEASIAKLHSSEALCRVVDRAIQIHGGVGVTKELPLERWYREARGRLVAAGSSETLRLGIARALLEP